MTCAKQVLVELCLIESQDTVFGGWDSYIFLVSISS